MSSLSPRRKPELAKTRGPLTITRADGSTTTVSKGDASRAAGKTVARAHAITGRQPFD